MSMKCYICNHNIEKKVTSIDTDWGDCKLTVDDVRVYVCPNCGEEVLESGDIKELQKISKKLADKEIKELE